MIFIDDTKRNVIRAKNDHCKIVSNYINRQHLKNNNDICRFIKANLNLLINGTPRELFSLNERFYDAKRRHSYREYLIYLNAPKNGGTPDEILIKKKYNRLHKRIEKIINYSLV